MPFQSSALLYASSFQMNDVTMSCCPSWIRVYSMQVQKVLWRKETKGRLCAFCGHHCDPVPCIAHVASRT